MRCVDVNVLVYSHRQDSPDHASHRAWLDQARTAREPLGIADIVASGFLRIVTHPRIFQDPTPLDVALEFVDAVRSSPSTTWVTADRGFARFPGLRVEHPTISGAGAN